MAEPLPYAEWWPLKWSPETRGSYALAKISVSRGDVWVLDRFHNDRQAETPRYDVHLTAAEGVATRETRVRLVETLFELRPLILKLAYPGGKYG
jgi:hypothetical protein